MHLAIKHQLIASGVKLLPYNQTTRRQYFTSHYWEYQVAIPHGSHSGSPALHRPLKHYDYNLLHCGMINVEADALSRGKVVQEWALQQDLAQVLFRIWGLPEVDLFA